MSWARRAAGAGAVAVALVLAAAPAAAQEAGSPGSCQGTIDNEPASAHRTTGTAHAVDADATVAVSGEAPGAGGQRYLVELELVGRRWAVAKGDVTGERWSGQVKVEDYSGHSVGLFKVIGSTRDRATDAVLCEDFMFVEVGGRSPLTTTAGLAGAAALGGGLALIASAAGQARRAGLGSVPAAGPELGAAAVSARGVSGGVLSGLGTAVELQQFAVAFLTPGLFLGCLAGGVAVGVVVPLVLAGGTGSAAGPAAGGLTPAWGSHVAPPGGLATWPAPDPTAPGSEPIVEGVPVLVVERQGDWARVECANGWSAWVDGRLVP